MCLIQGSPLQDMWAKLTACEAGRALESVYMGMLSEKDVYVCVRILKDWIERSEARLSRMGLGSIPHVLRGQAGDKRRYSREAKTEVNSSQSGWQAPQQCHSSNKTSLGLRSCTGHASSSDLHKTFKTLISYQNANILSDGPKKLV